MDMYRMLREDWHPFSWKTLLASEDSVVVRVMTGMIEREAWTLMVIWPGEALE